MLLANQPLTKTKKTSPIIIARKIILSGQVQGVGFRPFIYRLANELNLKGWVKNCMGTVDIHIQGPAENLQQFTDDIFTKHPPLSKPQLETSQLTSIQVTNDFSILQSQKDGDAYISVPADLFLCDDCLNELNDPTDRRFEYPFINCTQCGPRYTLIRNLPYDRINTTMAKFKLCPACSAEYNDPANRRFHAEPIACADCGPSLSYKDKDVEYINDNSQSLEQAISALQQNKILAIKGIGGYHLMCDATNTDAILKLRDKKPRPDKPLVVMFPAPANRPFEIIDKYVILNEQEKIFLLQASRPILLVEKRPSSNLSSQIAPALNEIGVMLPYSPLHHLLLNKFNCPLVATSANISGEPVLISNDDIETKLAHVADGFLHHNRKIQRPADDPVYRIIANKPRPIRIGRGIAPLEIRLPFELKHPVLAVGAQMKNVITLAWKNRAIISPYIGEMHSPRSLQVFEKTISDLQALYAVKAEHIICDAHSGYTTSRWAEKQNLPVHTVFHHHAHASAAYYESDTSGSIIVFTWDGTGYGEDGTLWSGEALHGKPGEWNRAASIRPFYLPGGDKAGRQPWRSAAALCWEIGIEFNHAALTDASLDLALLKQAWQKGINTPQTSSIGRLFDGAAALCDVCSVSSYEGQGPMEFEALVDKLSGHIELPLNKVNDCYIADWEPLIRELLNTELNIHQRSCLFHNSLAFTLLQQARAIRKDHGTHIVSFSGGVFQNRVLTEVAIALLEADGFSVYLPQQIPLNDSGISFGQIIEYGCSPL
jgi:hydrogenase maturation protein HypF